MNAVEKIVYHSVKRFPRVKFMLRDTYQSLCDLIPVPPEKSAYPIVRREGFFFGFHDKCPFSPDNSRLLAGKFDIPLRMPRDDDALEVGYFDGEDYRDFHSVGRTHAWNWHLGCNLQWRGTGSELVYNDFESGALVARVLDVDNSVTRTVDSPVGAVSPDGRRGLSYSFPRVNRYMPGYGYINGDDPSIDDPVPGDSGLSLVVLESGDSTFLFSIREIADIEPDSSMSGSRHYFSHCQFSPSNRRFVFLHRWVKDDVRRRWSRMITADLDGGNIHVFPTAGMVSHLCWRDENHVLAYCRIAGEGDRYVLFRDRAEQEQTVVGRDDFDSDGHPSFAPGGRWMVTDTYPNRFRLSSLFVYDCKHERKYEVARLKASKKFATSDQYRHWKVDLHPRWNRDGSMLCFDASYSGERSLCTLSLGNDLHDGSLASI
jgi:hypothetical protein